MTPAAIAADLIHQFNSADFPAALAAYADQLSLEVLRELADHISRALSRKPGQAIVLAQVAQAVAERLGDPFAQAMALHFLAAAHNHSGDLPQALALSHEAEAAFQACQQPLRVTSVKINRVATLRNMGRYAEAIALAAEARAEYEALGDPRPDFLANLEVNVAWALWQTGEVAAATACYERAGQTYEAMGQHWAAAVTYMDRAILAEEQARFSAAERLLAQARAILAAEDLAKERAHVDLNLGILAFKTGRLQTALHHLELAHDELESQQLAHAVATVNHYRAQVYLQLNLAQEAIRLAHQARQSFKRDRRAGMLLLSHLNLAGGYRQLGQLSTAHEYLERARRLARRLAATPTLNEIDAERARLALDQARPARAHRIARRVLQQLQQAEYPTLTLNLQLIEAQSDLRRGRWQQASHRLQVIAQAPATNLTPALRLQLTWLEADLQAHQGAYVVALAAYETAAQQLIWQHRQLVGDETGLDFLADKTAIFAGIRRCSHILATTGRFTLTQLAAKLELALELPAAASSPQSPAPTNSRMEALQQRWHWLQNRLEPPFALLDNMARRELDPEQLRQELRQVEIELAELHRRQQASARVNTSVTATSAPTPVPERPDPGTAVLHFYQVDEQCQALLISAAGSQLFTELVSTGFISQWQRAWRLHLDQISQFGDGPAERASAAAYLQMLYDKLLAPILATQPDLERWQFVLPPEWHDLPLAAAFDGELYLCERLVLHYGKSLQPVPQFTDHAFTGPTLLVGHSDDGRLPHVAVELQAIARRLNRPDTVVLSETEATVAALQAHLPSCRLLHIATHALFRPDNPLFSWLRLADQRLTIQALAQLELSGQPLVVLSACETGRGRPRGGGLQGLVRTLRQAGASALIVSQWRTEDLANAELMAHFYDALASGQPPAQALAGAQQAMAASGRHPFYWSGYLLTQ